MHFPLKLLELKDLPKFILDNLAEDSKLAKKLQADEFNLKLQIDLIKKVNMKSIRKNYKSKSVKRVWMYIKVMVNISL